ncbi:hypothetical protein A2715_01425 [Candidatus Woesebacteria bacterium RIFCSPHIGHO2_01_FULL_39_32]|uniref:Uncharacterized protein n=1 Tax=Candidatus Woesebacteria bacterium RIFCSPLOWO2_01_FULL_39_25 TaxID=1802521 RepID=A0A1F8BJH4_9BACT|nr:MAG: hypothetical protein A2124_03795 [Candidatus Woesebacteria bacterium GWB1_37_5]OGM24142.1 MAG: hypothetical protein A2715_01425 [Candidatus Woesebacteria bacterium RIFCSPHIGHO2_01_FULL_39_32]OGM38118.1 MAG: hypothetical protein A3F01_02195 [Candidatus Woesebacteria bacterium RIFCSPHIGHO2_12_FULL_38_11]OGM64224.1 MAG: hypothetical protein A2893_06690 [Candidatus Woesebacteria bacterium RIFCSPLOWO2_01_FULL_39_25]
MTAEAKPVLDDESVINHENIVFPIFKPLVINPEISTVPQPVWTRTEKPLGISGYSDRVFITLNKIPRGNQPSAIDASIRLRFGNASYILRYDEDDGGYYKDWELIQTVPVNGSPGGKDAEQVVFRQIQTVPEIVLDDTLAPEWQWVLQHVTTLITTMPSEYPEKKILQDAWNRVRILDKTSHDKLVKEKDALARQNILKEKERWRKSLHTPLKPPSPLRMALDRITSRFRK